MMDTHPILHASDGSQAAVRALDLACELAISRKAPLLIVHVQRQHGRDSVPPELEEFSRIEQGEETEMLLFRRIANHIAADAERRAKDLGVSSVETVVLEGDPATRIVDAAREHGARMIVMGSRGLGDMQGLMLGSVSHKVAHIAPCTCITVR